MRPNPKQRAAERLAWLEKQCSQWNEKHPIGTLIRYSSVIGERGQECFRTRTLAQVLSGHTAVIWLDGKSGCVSLEACTPEPSGSDPSKADPQTGQGVAND